jgi:hypothetical protein
MDATATWGMNSILSCVHRATAAESRYGMPSHRNVKEL